MLYLHFLQLINLVSEMGNEKSKSSYLFISNNRKYLRVYLTSLKWDTQETLDSCRLKIWEFL